MTEVSQVVDELRGLVGIMTQPVVNEVERGAIRRYAEAVGESNPLYTDVDYARNSRYGEVISPPGFFGWPTRVSSAVMEVMGALFGVLFKAGLIRILDAGREYEFFLPVRAGDMLAWYAKFADVTEREGKTGKMVFLTTEITYVNQNGDQVARARQTFIAR
ncbi:MAG: MaoC family dehydratase N-terminal domain-containing protein [Dehalococcoidia bacterium]